jgi:hypothetical protein
MPRWKTFEVPLSQSREYWMIYRRPGFLAVVWFGSSHSLLSARCFSFSIILCVADRAHSLTGEGRRRGWEGSQMILQRESMVLYKSFNTLWVKIFQKDNITSMLILPGIDSWQCHPGPKISENFPNHRSAADSLKNFFL